MSEQVGIQVREGVWLTREGEEIEVRARDTTGFNTEWRWEGKRRGYYNTWRDDGTIHIEREQKEGDLMQFLRPLPEPEPTAAPEPAPEPVPEPVPEPQPVQVRAGIWKTRSGREVEVRERYSLTGFRWVGVLLGINESWRDDGQWSVKNETNHRDLVEYVGPLPQAEPEAAPEPQQLQVREGVWRTRGGQEAEVRARRGKFDTEFRWVGLVFGVLQLWRDDGRWSGERDHHCDLVEYVGPLPQQTTTDTLAEIEEQAGETLQEALGRALEQAYIADLKNAIDAVTADRDRLQQAHQTMTKHSAELLESAQQARESRDSLEQQLATMTYGRDEVANELRAMTDHCSRQREQLESLSASRDQLAILLSNAQCAHDMTQRQVQQLQAELRQARIELDAEKETPAANCRAVVDAHLVGAQNGRQAAFEAVERWVEVLAGVDSEHAAAVLQALPGCIRKLAELEGVTW